MSVWVAMGPAKGRDVDQAELRLRLSASLDAGAARADRRHRAWRRRARRPWPVTPSASTASSASWSTPRTCTRRRRSPSARSAGTDASRSSSIPTSICSWCSARRSAARKSGSSRRCCTRCGTCGSRSGITCARSPTSIASTRRNPEYLLSLMDLRPLAGDRDLIDQLQAVMKSSAPAWRPQILDALVTLTDQRHSEFHDTLYQLEPDVKDGPGALRDVWATRMLLRLGGDRRRVARGTSPDRLSDAEEFLMRIRSGLHLDTGRNVNVLSYELQEKAVDRLRYAGPDMRRRVEALMTDYFKDARSVTRALGRVRRAALPPAADPDSPDRREPDVGGRRHHVRRRGDGAGRAGRMASRVRCRGLAQRAGGRRCARADRARAAEAQLRARRVPSDARTSAPPAAVHAAAPRPVGAARARCAIAACSAPSFPS